MNEPLEVSARTLTREVDNHEEIAALAYTFWSERGYPVGSPEVDWFRALQEIRKRKRLPYAVRELAD